MSVGWRTLRRVVTLAGLAAAIAAGAAMRLAWHGVIEWKADERWTYAQAQAMAATGAWPPVGMPSSLGPPNPGLSLWVFAGFVKLFGVRSPPDLAMVVQAVNVIALIAFVAFVFLEIPLQRREPWLWAAALWAVNPIAIILERKIWPPSVLPLFTVAFLFAWSRRRHPAAAFAWGALGALMAQIHMGAAFFAFAIAAWTLVADRGRFPWRGWTLGSVVGVLPAIPWALRLAAQGAGAHARLKWPAPNYFMRWPTEMFAYDVKYTLGGRVIWDFLAGPRIDGAATHLTLLLYASLVACALVVLVRGAETLLVKGAPGGRAVFLGASPETVLICASLWGYGGLLTLVTLAGAGSYRHYMIVATPIMALWTAMAVGWTDGGWRRGWARPILSLVCVLGAVMSFSLLSYIDAKGVIQGEFGTSWQAQQLDRGATPESPRR